MRIGRRYWCLILGFVFFTECSDKETNPDWWLFDYWGEITAIKNNESLERAFIIGYGHPSDTMLQHSGLGIGIDIYNELNTESESLTFIQIPCEIGKYDLVSSDPNFTDLPIVSYLTIVGGDVAGDVYKVDTLKVNVIEITELTDDNEVYGTFELNMFRDTSRPPVSSRSLDTVRITEGYFHTRLTTR